MNKFMPLIGRILISLIFIRSFLSKLGNFAGTQERMHDAGMPIAGFFLVMAIVIEIAGVFSILSGYKSRWGAVLLIVFLIPTTLIFHTDFSAKAQITNFYKNIAIIGGLAMIAYFGSGPISLDNFMRRRIYPSVPGNTDV